MAIRIRFRCYQPILFSAFALILTASPTSAAEHFPWPAYAAKSADWCRSDEAAHLADNVLSHQSPRGDWPKNIDTSKEPYKGDRSRIEGTFDNSATVGEMRFLAKLYNATQRE